MGNQQIEISTGVDWLTLTSVKGGDAERYKAIFHSLSAIHKRWSWHGFLGHTSDNGDLSWGINPVSGRAILVCRGGIATTVFALHNFTGSNCSRFDLQATVTLPEEDEYLLTDIYNSDKIRKVKTRNYWENFEGGATVYLGSRQSPRYYRIYDAGSKHRLAPVGMCFRFEIEFKTKLALAVAREVRANAGLANVMLGDFIADYVAAEFLRIGVKVPYTAKEKPAIVGLTARAEDGDRTLKWFREQVNPAIAKMLEAGYERDILDAFLYDDSS